MRKMPCYNFGNYIENGETKRTEVKKDITLIHT